MEPTRQLDLFVRAKTSGRNVPRGAWRGLAVGLIGTALSACSSLLPSTKDEVVSNWNSYDDAVKSLATLVPYKATRQDVHREGLDPSVNPAITIMHFADVLPKFTAAALVRKEDVDRGIRDCLHAGKECSAYQITVKKTELRRIGDFWLDSLNFKRESLNRGWSVDALLVFVDDLLVYELVGGHPVIDEYQVRRNPLGPLQNWGDRIR